MVYSITHRNEKLEPNLSATLSSQDQQQTATATNDETQPLMKRHISIAVCDKEQKYRVQWKNWLWHSSMFNFRALLIVTAIALAMYASSHLGENTIVIPIEQAIEHTINVGSGLSIWFRTWGLHDQNGYYLPPDVPAVLFVHGGPGQAVVDYNNGNKRFFDAEVFFVVEVDQRGTGNSKPSVRDDYHNMKYYQDVSIDLIAHDFEEVRKYLGIQEWVVWGGSYGSTIALNYCMLYPESCTSLLLRGIYLDTQEELSQVYSRGAFEDDERKLAEFNILYDFAQGYHRRNVAGGDTIESKDLDPNDYEGLLGAYEEMITQGDAQAIWTWHTFENNLMEDRPENQLDPGVIKEDKLPEAQSVAFFETRLWLHGAFEHPSKLLERVHHLKNIPIWICQGIYDNVCPVQNAWNLVKALKMVHHRHPSSYAPGYLQAYFLDANHEDTDPVMESCLKKIMNEFLEMNNPRISSQPYLRLPSKHR